MEKVNKISVSGEDNIIINDITGSEIIINAFKSSDWNNLLSKINQTDILEIIKTIEQNQLKLFDELKAFINNYFINKNKVLITNTEIRKNNLIERIETCLKVLNEIEKGYDLCSDPKEKNRYSNQIEEIKERIKNYENEYELLG